MKLIVWNCNMAFRKKAKSILALKPDILIVPECEDPENVNWDTDTPVPDNSVWQGANRKKGLGIFSYSDYKFEVLDEYDPLFKIIVPVRVSSPTDTFILIAIWANNVSEPRFQYIGQVWKAIQHYDQLLKNEKVILAGDFNSNTIWDKPRREFNHTTVVNMLAQKNIFSAYHSNQNAAHGKEMHATLYMYRHRDKPYHIDYCFASERFLNTMSAVYVGEYENWGHLSDHMPLSIDFKSAFVHGN